jgi:hypothetical protein
MQIIFFLIFGAINAFIADRKGFNPIIWFFAAGLLGLIVLAIMPSANEVLEDDEELYLKRKRAGNTAGLIILGVAVLLILSIFVFMASL